MSHVGVISRPWPRQFTQVVVVGRILVVAAMEDRRVIAEGDRREETAGEETVDHGDSQHSP